MTTRLTALGTALTIALGLNGCGVDPTVDALDSYEEVLTAIEAENTNHAARIAQAATMGDVQAEEGRYSAEMEALDQELRAASQDLDSCNGMMMGSGMMMGYDDMQAWCDDVSGAHQQHHQEMYSAGHMPDAHEIEDAYQQDMTDMMNGMQAHYGDMKGSNMHCW